MVVGSVPYKAAPNAKFLRMFPLQTVDFALSEQAQDHHRKDASLQRPASQAVNSPLRCRVQEAELVTQPSKELTAHCSYKSASLKYLKIFTFSSFFCEIIW